MSEVNLIHNHSLGTSLQLETPSSDYIGFRYNGKHSSDLGIVRTSEGSRFNENLLPTMQDKTVQVPGGDGTYYFGSYFTQRLFTVSFAFDALTEQQFAQLQAHFGDKGVHDLIFDERPYKIYRAKVTGTATIKHIPFTEGATNRLYKGEGTIQFTCYQPYARCENKWLDLYTNDNKIEWAAASKLLITQGNYDKLEDNKILIYNPGVKESDFIFTFNFNSDGKIPATAISISDVNNSVIYKMLLKEIARQGDDTCIKINSKLNLIEGYKLNAEGKEVKTGKVYNKYIQSGFFFKIPQSDIEYDSEGKPSPKAMYFVVDAANSEVLSCLTETPLEYNYYYF